MPEDNKTFHLSHEPNEEDRPGDDPVNDDFAAGSHSDVRQRVVLLLVAVLVLPRPPVE